MSDNEHLSMDRRAPKANSKDEHRRQIQDQIQASLDRRTAEIARQYADAREDRKRGER